MSTKNRGPCKDAKCGHPEMKHDLKGSERCMLRDCPCEKYKT